eukprot:736850-Pyramimonas_sp.AAC.1
MASLPVASAASSSVTAAAFRRYLLREQPLLKTLVPELAGSGRKEGREEGGEPREAGPPSCPAQGAMCPVDHYRGALLLCVCLTCTFICDVCQGAVQSIICYCNAYLAL